MTQNTASNSTYKNPISAFFFENRIVISKGTKTIVNMPLLAGFITFIFIRWMIAVAVVLAMALGFQFAIRKKADGDARVLETMLKGAAENLKSTASSMGQQAAQAAETAETKQGTEGQE